jgi:hypothetical protein
MCVHARISPHTCARVCVAMRKRVRVIVCMGTCTCEYVRRWFRFCVHGCLRALVCACVRLFVSVFVRVCARTRVRARACVHACVSVACVSLCARVCLCVCVRAAGFVVLLHARRMPRRAAMCVSTVRAALQVHAAP